MKMKILLRDKKKRRSLNAHRQTIYQQSLSRDRSNDRELRSRGIGDPALDYPDAAAAGLVFPVASWYKLVSCASGWMCMLVMHMIDAL